MAILFSRSTPKPTQPVTETPIPTPSSYDPLTSYMRNYVVRRNRTLQSASYQSSEHTIHVSEVFGVLALVYEKVRTAIEYKRDHLLKRNAIERILKRLLWERQGRNMETTAHLLLRELIWAHYLPNDTIPQVRISEIAHSIQKYLALIDMMGGYNAVSAHNRDWIIGVLSVDIEESLDPLFQRESSVELMYQWFKSRFVWQERSISDHEKDMQLYLAIHRSLPKSDDSIMRYHLLMKEFPQWKNPNKNDIMHLAQVFSKIQSEITTHLNHPIHLSLFRKVKKYAPPFEILQETLNKYPHNIEPLLSDPEALELKIREICQMKYNQIRRKVNRGIARSIVYILVTKVLLAMLIEIPYELIVLKEIAFASIAINVLVPPFLMFIIGLTIKTPNEQNTRRILDYINNIVYQQYRVNPTSFSVLHARKRSFLTTFFSIIYLLLFTLTFGGISFILYQLHFNIVSATVFFVFLSLVLLFGFRVRSTATELKVTGEKEGLFSYILSNLSLPFLNFGVLLSRGIAKLNIFILIMDFLIEAPLKTVIEVIEEWTSFIREKREEVVEIPPQ